MCCIVFFSSRRRHTRCALVTGVQTCALPIFADLLAATLPTESRLVVAWSDVRIDGGLSHTGNAPHALIARARGCLEHFVPDTADAEIVDAWHDTGTRI